MKFNKILVALISLLFLLLVACNNTNDNEDASKNDPSEESAISFTKTDNPSGDLQTDQIENQNNQGNFNTNMFGLGEDDKNWNQREQNRQGLDGQDLDQFRQDQQGQDQQQQGDQGQRNQQGQQGQMQQQQDQQTQDDANQTQPQQGQNEYTSNVIKLTNQERSNQGLSPLKAHKKLSNVARNKAQDMQSNGYFSHTSPTYGSPFDMMKNAGVSYQSAGENIARGQKSPQQVVDAWMNSQGHRENILNENFTHIGVGYTESGNYWSQMFIQK
ncbi:CAP domain-containing protein [Virgibacillus sp. JSM 102003]|uniref:CAP domain-containing protein n=1 Tax=Virgibacillus sp. JSM 102003 TaxID=1562108 RepID=UPI0035BEC62C